MKALVGTKPPLEKLNYLVTALFMPASQASFAATGRSMAHRDLALCAIAARQYERKHGELPAALANLVPEFLPAVPTDPFDGKPLRLIAGSDGLTFYSIGRDQKDDGGTDRDQSGEPDVVVQVKRK